MIGIIAGEIIGSPYSKHNLSGPGERFEPFADHYYTSGGRTASTYMGTASPSAGAVTDAVLNCYLPDGAAVVSRYSSNPGAAFCMSIVQGRLNGAAGLTPDEHVRRFETFLSGGGFPEALKGRMRTLSEASYLLSTGQVKDISSATGIRAGGLDYTELSLRLHGAVTLAEDGEMVPSDGEPNCDCAIEAAVWAIGTTFSYMEAVSRAVGLGGDSAAVAAVTGGLAELVYGRDKIPYEVSERALGYLDDDQRSLYDGWNRTLDAFHSAEDVAAARAKMMHSPAAIRTLSVEGKSPVYAVPEERADVSRILKDKYPDAVFVSTVEFDELKLRVAGEQRVDVTGQPLGAAYIAASHPEERTLYFSPYDGVLRSSLTLPDAYAKGIDKMVSETLRTANRARFEDFRQKCIAIRDEQERSLDHDPTVGHLQFDNAWWLDIERDRVVLKKGQVAFAAYGIDAKGRFGPDTTIIGGTLMSGDRLLNALDNARLFYWNTSSSQALEIFRMKCLDEGVSADKAIRDEGCDPIYIKPEGEEHIPDNYELMSADIASALLNREELQYQASVKDDAFRKSVESSALTAGRPMSARARDAVAHKGAVFTFGTSNHTIYDFIGTLKRYGITRVLDTRLIPGSKSFPHFNRDAFSASLKKEGISYEYVGDILGGRMYGRGVLFTESAGGYAQRTRENAQSTDLTFAFAADFNTAGERATETAAKGKIFQISVNRSSLDDAPAMAREVVDGMTEQERSAALSINIAGNGMQTFAAHGISQSDINNYVYSFLGALADNGVRVSRIVSGGQTGADEAGIVAAASLGIPAEVHAPKGWQMRGPDGRDVCNETAFKARFSGVRESEQLSYGQMMSEPRFQEAIAEVASRALAGERQVLVGTEYMAGKSPRFACVGYALAHPELRGSDVIPTVVQHISYDGSLIPQEAMEKTMCKGKGIAWNTTGFYAMMDKFGKAVQFPDPKDRPMRFGRAASTKESSEDKSKTRRR